MAANVDQLKTKKSLIDLSGHSKGDFGLDDYKLTKVMSDVILVSYVDISGDDGDVVKRGNLFIPTNALKSAWRKAEVILVGPEVNYTSVGDIVIFPNEMGITVAGIDVEGYGKVSEGIFLSEARIFGICQAK